MKDINLIPQEYILIEKRKKFGFFMIIVGIFAIAVLAVLITTPMRIINEKKQTLAQLNAELKDPKYNIIDELKKELSQKQDEKVLLNNLLEQVDYNTIASRTTLDILTGHLPPGMHISEIQVSNEKIQGDYPYIRIFGAANDFRTVSDYAGQLMNLPFIRDTVINTQTETIADKGYYAKQIEYDITLYVDKTKGSVSQDEE